MMRICLVLTLLFASPALAGGLWVELHGGLTNLAMDDLNNKIDDVNRSLEAELSKPSSSTQFSLVVGRNLDSKNGSIGLIIDSFTSSDSYSDSDPEYSTEYKVPALAFSLFFSGFVPWFSSDAVATSFGTSIGMLASSGDVKYFKPAIYNDDDPPLLIDPEIDESAGLKKVSPFLNFFLTSTLKFGDRMGLAFKGGYRVMPPQEFGVELENIGGDYALDYSGLYGTVGIRYLLGS